ncbi:MAG: hypothetical protein R8M11_01190 [Gallionella sp.]
MWDGEAAVRIVVMDLELAKILISIIVGLGGWYVVHRLSASRDQINKRKDLKVEYLLKAYRSLSNAANRTNTDEFGLQFEEAVSDIQLLGSPKQIKLLHKALSEMDSNGNHVCINDVLDELRVDLRRELALEPVATRAKFFRFSKR